MIYAIVAVIALIADQWLKYWVTVNITLSTGANTLIPGVLKLVNIHNTGAAFSILSDVSFARWIFLGLAAAVCVVLIVVIAKRVFKSKFATWCMVLFMAGAAGNCIDRALYGYVVDMFKLDFVNFAVFNLADAILVVSCLLFIIYLFVGGKDEDELEEIEEVEEEPVKEKKSKKSRKAKNGEDDSDELEAADEPAEKQPKDKDSVWSEFAQAIRPEVDQDAPVERPTGRRSAVGSPKAAEPEAVVPEVEKKPAVVVPETEKKPAVVIPETEKKPEIVVPEVKPEAKPVAEPEVEPEKELTDEDYIRFLEDNESFLKQFAAIAPELAGTDFNMDDIVNLLKKDE